MGRIGRSYPRFEEASKPAEDAGGSERSAEERISAYQVVGAIVGILSALGLIGWLLSR
jgi:hypothetical protein